MQTHHSQSTTTLPVTPSEQIANMNASLSSKQCSSVESFLDAHRCVGKEQEITHTAFGGIAQGKFHIPQVESKHFHDLLAQACFRDDKKISIVERHGVCGPVVVDLDIEYLTDTNQDHPRVYSGDSVEQILRLISYAIDTYVDVPDDRKTKLIYVFEKPKPTFKRKTDDGKCIWKDGLHIMFPNIITCPQVQKFIRQDVLSDFVYIIQSFEENGYQILNTAEEIYDESVIERNGWIMYGSCKPDKPPYSFTQIWHGDCENLHKYTQSECGTYQEIFHELSMHFFGGHQTYDGEHKGATIFLENISIRGYDSRHKCSYKDYYEIKKANEIEEKKKKRLDKKKKNPNITWCDDDSDLEFASELVDYLSTSRIDNYESWSRLGWCLHHIHNADDTLLQKFIQISQKSSKYSDIESEESCEKLWKDAYRDSSRSKLQIGSLCQWVKEDNPLLFKQAQQKQLRGLIEECCNRYMPYVPSEKDDKGKLIEKKSKPVAWDSVAYYLVEVLRKKYHDELVCSSFTNKIWWEFKNHRWTDNTIGLRNVLSVDVYELFEHFATEQSKQLELIDPSDPKRSNYERLRNAARGIAQNCRNTGSKDKTIKEAAERFYWGYRAQDKLHEQPFEQILDQDLYLIGMENGVYDLINAQFRQGHSEDYISRNTGNCWYEPKDGWNDPVVKDILQFVSQVLPDKSVREYVLTLFASFCDGKIQERFHIFVGCGGNGKSKLIDLFTNALGQSGDGGGYCGNLPVTALTGKRPGSNAATPEFERLKGMRFVVVQEPDQKESMQVGRLKELTGGDTIQARALHKEPIEYKPQFGMVMASNVLPTVPGDDGGVWRRMRVVRFNSKFKENPDPNDMNEFPIDLNLTEKLEKWAPAFFWILMKYYQVFRSGDHGEEPILQYSEGEPRANAGLRRCVFVEEETHRYRSRNDKFNTFITIHVNPNPEKASSAVLPFDALWLRYTAFCKEQHVQPNQDDLQDAMELRYDTMHEQNGFRGWKKISLWTEIEIDNRTKEAKDNASIKTPSLSAKPQNGDDAYNCTAQ